MNFYWVYDIPNWTLAVLAIVVYVAFGATGMAVTRKVARVLHIQDHSHNDIVSYYLAAVTVFYGITLGLVAIGTWNSFSAVSAKVDNEAQVISSLYRDASSLPEPYRTQIKNDVKRYTRNVIDVSWPLQRKGLMPSQSGFLLDTIQKHLMDFEPNTVRYQIVDTELFKQYNLLVEVRRSRLNSISTNLPAALWSLVIIGGLVCITVTFFFDVKSIKMHLTMTCFFSGLLGLMVFLIATLDNPFRGTVSVTPKPLEIVYHQLMSK